jgi:hypothetical protein
MSFLSRLFGDTAKQRLAAAAEHARAGRFDEATQSWVRAVELKPQLIPNDAQLAALEPALPRVARQVLDQLSVPTKHWKLERRGSLDGEERWRLEQDKHWTMAKLAPTLHYVALVIVHTSAAPGRLRIDCDRIDDDSEAYLPLQQMGEAVITWDEARRITDVRVQE